jgi:hypothetical protein
MEGKTVKQARNNKGYVFLYQGKPMKHVVTAFKTACNRAGIPYGRNTLNGLFTTCDIASVLWCSRNMEISGSHSS